MFLHKDFEEHCSFKTEKQSPNVCNEGSGPWACILMASLPSGNRCWDLGQGSLPWDTPRENLFFLKELTLRKHFYFGKCNFSHKNWFGAFLTESIAFSGGLSCPRKDAQSSVRETGRTDLGQETRISVWDNDCMPCAKISSHLSAFISILLLIISFLCRKNTCLLHSTMKFWFHLASVDATVIWTVSA